MQKSTHKFLSFNSIPVADSDSISRLLAQIINTADCMVCFVNVIIRIRSDCNGKTSSDYTEIVVIWHGKTEWITHHKIQLAQQLSSEHKISAVYSSNLKQALETAQTIANACGGLGVIIDPDLRERHVDNFQCLVFSQASNINLKAYQAYASMEIDQEIPGGGEGVGQLLRGTKSSLERIGNKHRGEGVTVVTDGGLIEALQVQARPREKPGRLTNACLNVFHLFANGEWIIEAWADVTHLNQMAFSE